MKLDNITTIFKREKAKRATMPEPNFDDNWLQKRFEENVKGGVSSLKKGNKIRIMDDGRGYELALQIKNQFILEYQRQLSEKIEIQQSINGEIEVSFKKSKNE